MQACKYVCGCSCFVCNFVIIDIIIYSITPCLVLSATGEENLQVIMHHLIMLATSKEDEYCSLFMQQAAMTLLKITIFSFSEILILTDTESFEEGTSELSTK